MKRTKGSQSEIGILYQYGVTALLAAKLSTDTSVEDYVIYSSDDSAGKFDDIVARVKMRDNDEWYLSLIQVKYKQTNNLDVSDTANGKSIKYFLSDYIKSFNKIITDSKLVCRRGISSENIQFGIFCNQSIQTPVILRKENTFELDLWECSEKSNINKTLLPFGNKSWKFACENLDSLECQTFFNRCHLCLQQPNYTDLNQHIEKACDIASAVIIINYVKDYFNNDYLYKQGLTREIFEVELQRIRYIDAIPPITSLLDLVGDGRITIWKDITLNHDITTIDCYEGIDIERCLYSCLIQCLNNLLNTNIDWKTYVGKTCNLASEIINKFIAHSKTKKIRFWINPPNTLRMLLMELWKSGDLPLILKTHTKLTNFEKCMHFKRNYVIIDDWTNRLEEISTSKLKIFSDLNSICHLELQERILTILSVSIQGSIPRTLKDILGDDKELMSKFTCANILDMMKKRKPFLKQDYFKGNNYLAFIVEDDDCADTVQPTEPYTIGGNITMRCHPSKTSECIKAIQIHAIYQNYEIYRLQKVGEKLVLAEGDRCQLSQHFVDQYEDPLYICEQNKFVPVIGKLIVRNEPHYIQRCFKKATVVKEFFSLQEKLVCLLSGDVDTIQNSLSITSLDSIQNSTTLIENKTYFIKIGKEERQNCWRKLCNLGYPLIDINVRAGRMELLRYKNCKNLSSYISFDSKLYSDNELFEEVAMLENRILVVTGDAGVGKTSFLKWLCNHYYANKYIFFYDLINLQLFLTKTEFHDIDPLEFIFKQNTKGVSKKYSKFLFTLWQTKKIVCVLDSFDEVRTAYEKQVLEFVRHIADSGIQIVVATRLPDCKILVDLFKVQVIKIESFDSSKQNDYLPIWQLHEHLLENVSPELITIPLHLNFLRMISVNQEKLSNITKFGLYEKVVTMKIRRCLQRTTRIVYNSEIDRTIMLFERLALVVMFGKETIEQELMWTCEKELNDYTKFGIVTSFEDGNYPVFYHYTFVEFLVAQWISKNHRIKMYKATARYFYKKIINENKLYILNILSEDLDLHRAILQTDTDKIKLMIETTHKCLDAADKLGRIALTTAVICCGCSDRLLVSYQIVEVIVKSMLRNNNDMTKCDTIAGMNWSDYFQFNTFDFAVFFGITEAIKKYLSLQRRNIDKYHSTITLFPSKHFNSLFQTAIVSASGDMIADLLLLQNFENKMFYRFYQWCLQNTPETISLNKDFVVQGKLTPLHIACIYGSTAVIQRLIQFGADITAVDEFSCTPLHYSIMRCPSVSPGKTTSIDINKFDPEGSDATKLLLEAGANCNLSICTCTFSPLCLAIKARNVNSVRTLLEYGADLCYCTRDRNTPLHLAVMDACADTVQCLLEYGAPTFYKNSNGETPIDIATKQGLTNIAALLASAVKNADANNDIMESNSILILHQYEIPDIGNTPLHCAACFGDILQVKLFLRKGMDVNVRNKKGSTPLHKAAIGGSTDTAVLLLELGAEINAQNKYGETPLYGAVYFVNVDVVELLLKKGADPNIPKAYRQTILHAAVQNGNVDIVKVLVKGGAKLDVQNADEVAPLHIAAEKGYTDIVEYLLECGAEYNIRNDIGSTALHFAVVEGNTNITKILLNRGADIDIRNMQGHSPLQIAVIKENVDIVQLLLEWGANTNVQDIDGYTPLHIVAANGNEIIGKLLLDKAADVNAQSKNGDTILFIAAMLDNIWMIRQLFEASVRTHNKSEAAVLRLAAFRGYTDIVTLLLCRGVNVNASDKYGNTALHNAVSGGQTDIVELLLRNGAHVNTLNKNGFLALHGAVINNNITITKMLLCNGAKINAQSKDGETALLIASRMRNKDIVRLLLEANSNAQKGGNLTVKSSTFKANCSVDNNLEVDVNVSDKCGFTPLHLAVQHEQVEIVELLLQAHACVNSENKYGITPFHLAVQMENIRIARSLLNSGASINTQFVGGTALHRKIIHGHVDFVKLLVERGADINIRTPSGHNALHLAILCDRVDILVVLLAGQAKINEVGAPRVLFLAIEKKNENMVRLLVKHGMDTHIVDTNGAILLHFSIYNRHIGILKLFLEQNIDVNIQDNRGYTALHLAVTMQDVQIVQLLLKRSTNITPMETTVKEHYVIAKNKNLHINSLSTDTRNITLFLRNEINVNVQTKDGFTPLHFAVSNENLDIIYLLLNNGAKGTTLDINGNTPLHSAILKQRADIVSLLLKTIDDVNIQGKSGYTPLHLSIHVQNIDIVRLLLEAGAEVNIQTENGNTPLHIAVNRRNVAIVTFLLEWGADINICQGNGDTPLHFAVFEESIDITSELLEKGSNVHARNVEGAAPLNIAAQLGNTDLAKLLLDKGANINNQDEIGRSPLHYAVGNQRADIIPFLLSRGADIHLKSKYEITPLYLATYNQNKELVHLLLKYEKEINAQNETNNDSK